MTIVLDSWALMAFLRKEESYEKVRDFLTRAATSGKPCLMTAVNWGEIYYLTLREHGQDTTDKVMSEVASFPIEVAEITQDLARQAAIFKATKKMSYADCFAAALAKFKRAELVTGDKEFKELEQEIKILWL